MLKRIKIKNFRSHERLDLEFHEGVNVIYGLGQSGKTNILRAINWVVNNRPSGFNMHSHFAEDGKTSVELTFDNGVVKLSKTSKLTTYSLNKDTKFSYTGKSVPEPITQLMNLNEINISNQLDAPFLITDSPGEVGKVINRITKIEKVDSWIARLTTWSNQSKSEIDMLESDILKLQQDLTQYDGLEELESLINMHSKIEKILIRKQNSIENVSLKLEKWKNLQDHIDKFDIETLNSLFKVVNRMTEAIQEKEEKLNNIRSMMNSYIALSGKVEKLTINLAIIDGDLAELSLIDFNIQWKTDEIEILSKYVKNKSREEYLTKKIDQSKKEYLSLLSELHFCPLCGSKITDKIKETII